MQVVDAQTLERRSYQGRMIFLCASTLGSAQVLLNSLSERFPNGLANDSGMLGRNLMDHIGGVRVDGAVPGFEDKYTKGRRASDVYVPRFRNLDAQDGRFLRGFGYQGSAYREDWQRGTHGAGIGAELKAKLSKPGSWRFGMGGFGEMLPDTRNRVWLDSKRKDRWGIPLLHIDCTLRENELAMLDAMASDGKETLEAAGVVDVRTQVNPAPPGLLIHEMGTACMGHDPATSVLNKHNQAHDVPNLFVTDGACMTSSACQNPSLTYMAITARAAAAAVDMLKEGRI